MTGAKKICRDCRHYSDYDRGMSCGHPLALRAVDLVTGVEDRATARDMRADVKLCGPAGELFDAEPPTFIGRVATALGLSSRQL